LVGAIEWVIVAWSDWEYQVEKAFERMDSGERAGIGGGLAEGQTNGGVGGGV
jgi:MATE family multidrug resistance protein